MIGLRELFIGGLECLMFFVVTINFRACAKGKILVTVGTDVLIAGLGFQLTQMIAAANSWTERGAYIVGACLGSTLGMLLTKKWDTK